MRAVRRFAVDAITGSVIIVRGPIIAKSPRKSSVQPVVPSKPDDLRQQSQLLRELLRRDDLQLRGERAQAFTVFGDVTSELQNTIFPRNEVVGLGFDGEVEDMVVVGMV